jgi:hypothetical protein
LDTVLAADIPSKYFYQFINGNAFHKIFKLPEVPLFPLEKAKKIIFFILPSVAKIAKILLNYSLFS